MPHRWPVLSGCQFPAELQAVSRGPAHRDRPVGRGCRSQTSGGRSGLCSRRCPRAGTEGSSGCTSSSGTPRAQGLGSLRVLFGSLLAEARVPFPRGAPEPRHCGRTHIPRWPGPLLTAVLVLMGGPPHPSCSKYLATAPWPRPSLPAGPQRTDRGSMLCFDPRERGDGGECHGLDELWLRETTAGGGSLCYVTF